MKRVYFDFNATTPPDQELVEALPTLVQFWGNPSSVHWAGQAVKGKVRDSRLALAQLLNISPLEIVFTSGGSESNTTILQSIVEDCQSSSRNELIVSTVEHPSVLKTMKVFEEKGVRIHWIGFDRRGQFDFSHFTKVLSERTALVVCMMANNETGLVLPIQKIAEMAHQVGAKVFSDAVQALGKMPLDLRQMGVDYASFSGHKFYAFKGCGFFYAKKGAELRPLIYGGGQERHRRGGTENTLGINAMGFMAEKMLKDQFLEQKLSEMRALRDLFESLVQQQIPQTQITHAQMPRLVNTSSVVIQDVEGEALLMALDVKGFAVSTGSACSSGSSQPSQALLAFGLDSREARSSLRVSLGWTSSEEEVRLFVGTLAEIVGRLRRLVSKNERGLSL